MTGSFSSTTWLFFSIISYPFICVRVRLTPYGDQALLQGAQSYGARIENLCP